MRRCIIVTSYLTNPIRKSVKLQPDDYIICADGGYVHALREGIRPDVIIGDFDSAACPSGEIGNIVVHPSEKDDTDTLLCLKYGIEKGFNVFGIIGGTGGRLDHTMANIQTLAYGLERGKYVVMMDGTNIVTLVGPGTMVMPRRCGYKVSLLSYSEYCKGVSIRGVKYPLNQALLENSFPLGVSNEIVGEEAIISLERGTLAVMLSKDA